MPVHAEFSTTPMGHGMIPYHDDFTFQSLMIGDGSLAETPDHLKLEAQVLLGLFSVALTQHIGQTRVDVFLLDSEFLERLDGHREHFGDMNRVPGDFVHFCEIRCSAWSILRDISPCQVG